MKIKMLLLVCVLCLLVTACNFGGGDYPFGHPCNEPEAMFTDACP